MIFALFTSLEDGTGLLSAARCDLVFCNVGCTVGCTHRATHGAALQTAHVAALNATLCATYGPTYYYLCADDKLTDAISELAHKQHSLSDKNSNADRS